MKSSKLCTFYLQNRCKKGAECEFSHDSRPAPAFNPGNQRPPHFKQQNPQGEFQDQPNSRFRRSRPRAQFYEDQFSNSFPEQRGRGRGNRERRDDFPPNKDREEEQKMFKKKQTPQAISPFLQHVGNEEFLKNFNYERDRIQLPRIYLKSAYYYQGNLIFAVEGQTFVLIYDLGSHKFLGDEQKYLSTRINSNLNAISISPLGGLKEDIMLVSFDNFNEFNLNMTANVGILPVSRFLAGSFAAELEVSKEAPVDLLYSSASVVFVHFFNEKTSSGTSRIFNLTKLGNPSVEGLPEALRACAFDHPSSDRVTAVGSQQTVLFWGTESGRVYYINLSDGPVKEFGAVHNGKIVFIQTLELTKGDVSFLSVSLHGQVLVWTHQGIRHSATLSQQILSAKCAPFREGLSKKATHSPCSVPTAKSSSTRSTPQASRASSPSTTTRRTPTSPSGQTSPRSSTSCWSRTTSAVCSSPSRPRGSSPSGKSKPANYISFFIHLILFFNFMIFSIFL